MKRRRLPVLLLPLFLSGPALAEDLLELYRLAESGDPVLRGAQASFAAVREGETQSQARLRPNIDLGASTTRTQQDVSTAGDFDYTTNAYALSLRQALYRRDYLAQLKQSQARTRQAEAELNSARQGLVLRLSQRYFDALAASDNLRFAEAEKNAIQRQLDQTKQRFEVGLVAITDVHEAQAAYDLSTAAEIAARNQLEVAHQALSEVTGIPVQSLKPLIENMPLLAPDPADSAQWVNSALENNFQILAAQAAVETARQQLDLQRAGRKPTVDLVASHSYTDSSGGIFGSRSITDDSIGVQLNVPLYQGGGLSARVREARQQLTRAQEALEQQRRQTQRETSSAYLTVLADISRVQALKQAVVSSESAFKTIEAGYDVGTRTTVDVLNARRELYRAQRDYARARYDYVIATLQLKQASGMLSVKDVEQINALLQ